MHDAPLTKLLPLKRARKAKSFLVADLESKSDLSQVAGFTRPFLVGVYDGKEYLPFTDKSPPQTIDDYWSPGGCVDRAMRFLLQPRYRGRIIYAHNGGKFDFLHIVPWLQAEGYDFEIVPISSAILLLKVKERNAGKRAKPWLFIDSVKLIPLSVKKAAETFGTTTKESIDLNLPDDDPAWLEYNRVDCEALYHVLVEFHRLVEKDLHGQVGVTLPATAMALYRLRFLSGPLDRALDAHDMARAAYCGGRTEVFRSSGERLYYYDRNSSYPAAMCEPMPTGEAQWLTGKPSDALLQSHIGFVECDVLVPGDLDPPPLPIRLEDRLVFPTGALRGTFDSSELAYAMSLGCEVVRWGRSCWFTPEPILADFARELYWYRDKLNPDYKPGLAYIAKILLNSLYGKFGQHPEREQILRGGERVQVVRDATYIIPQISAHVTSLARIALHQKMVSCQRAGGHVYMCDTDSVVPDVYQESTTELGGWKDEYPEYAGKMHGKFLAPKMYYLWVPGSTDMHRAYQSTDVSVKAKGLETAYKNSSTLLLLARGDVIQQSRLEKVGSMARRGFASGPRMLVVPRRWLPDPGRKRNFAPDGTSKPLRVDMW